MARKTTKSRQKSKAESQMRRLDVARLQARGLSAREISQKLSKPYSLILRDLTAIRKDWKESYTKERHHWFNEQLAKIDQVEYEAWQAWDRSQNPTVKSETKMGSDGKPTTSTTRTTNAGDGKYLDIIAKCIDQRAKLIGLNKEEEVTGAGAVELMPVVEIVVDSREQIPTVLKFTDFAEAAGDQIAARSPA